MKQVQSQGFISGPQFGLSPVSVRLCSDTYFQMKLILELISGACTSVCVCSVTWRGLSWGARRSRERAGSEPPQSQSESEPDLVLVQTCSDPDSEGTWIRLGPVLDQTRAPAQCSVPLRWKATRLRTGVGSTATR